jgi:hypothetical protein
VQQPLVDLVGLLLHPCEVDVVGTEIRVRRPAAGRNEGNLGMADQLAALRAGL